MLEIARPTFLRVYRLAAVLVIVMILGLSLFAVAAPDAQASAPSPAAALARGTSTVTARTDSAATAPHVYFMPMVRKWPGVHPAPPPTLRAPAADAQIMQGYPNQNYGSTNRMWVGYDANLNPNGQITRGLVRFNLSAIPAGSTIISASLRLRVMGTYDFDGVTRLITTHRVTGTWTESTVTWNTAPGYAEAYGSAVIGHGEGYFDWYSFGVTSLVQAWNDGTYTNHGFMVRGPEQSGPSWRSFSTREGANPPRLEVSYVGPAGAPVTVTLEAAPADAAP